MMVCDMHNSAHTRINSYFEYCSNLQKNLPPSKVANNKVFHFFSYLIDKQKKLISVYHGKQKLY